MTTAAQTKPAAFNRAPQQTSSKLVIKGQMPEGITLRSVHTTVTGAYQIWGPNNRYPQDMLAAINSSSTGAACVDTKAKYIKGNGFADAAFYQAKVNRQGLQVDALLALHANDLASLYGFCGILNINLNGHPCEVLHAPFSQWRPAQPDSDGVVRYDYIIGLPHKLTKTNGLAATKAKRYPRFNPDETPAQRLERIALYCKAEKIEFTDYPGEVFVYFHKKSGALNHPRPLHDACLRDMLTEAALKISRHTDVRNGFAAQTMITEFGTATPSTTKLSDDKKKYQEIIGEEGVRLLVQYAKDASSAPKVETFAVNDAYKRYAQDEVSLRTNIRAMFLLPDLLYGEATAGKLGTSQEMEDAVNYAARLVVNEDQRAIELTYKAIFSVFQLVVQPGETPLEVGRFNASGNYTIQNLSLHPQATEDAEPTENQKRLALLASVPALLANELLKSFTDEEKRQLLDLPATPAAPTTTPAPAPAPTA